MKRWAVVAGCALALAACTDRPEPGALGPSAEVLPSLGDHIPQLSGAVSIDLSRMLADGSAPSQSETNPPGRATGVGPNLVANQDKTFFPQNETTVSMDPNNSSRLIAGANDYRNEVASCGVYASTDGGASWHDVGTGTTIPEGVVAGGDPATAFDPNGNAYYVCLGFTPATNSSSTTGLYVSKSSDLGTLTPVAPVVVTVTGGTDPLVGYFNDKEFIAIDTRAGSPHRGRIYVTWTRFKFDRADNYIESPIVLSYSDNGGLTWNGPHPVSSPDLNFDQGSVPAIGPNGEVYVVFENGNGTGFNGQAMVAKSVDGGNTFAHPVKVADIIEICDHFNVDGRCALKNSSWRVNSLPSVAVDAGSGNVYVTWGDYRSGNAEVLFSRSSDGGQTWSHPVQVSDDLTTSDKFFPWIAVAQDGSVQIAYQKRADTPGNRLLNTFLGTSRNGGLGFGKNIQVSDGATDPNFNFSGTFIGDYIGVAASATAVHPIWTDARRVVCVTLVCRHNQDAVTATVFFGS